MWILLILGIAIAAFWILYNVFRPGLNAIPGPFLARFSNLYRMAKMRSSQYTSMILEEHEKHGYLVRIGPNVVSVSDPRVVDDIYGVKSDFVKSDWYKPSQPIVHGQRVPTLLTLKDKKQHAILKRPIAGAYSTTSVLGYEPMVNDTIVLLLERLDEAFIRTGKPCDMENWAQYFAYDVVGHATMSRYIGFLKRGKDVEGILKSLQSELTYRAYTSLMPFLDDLVRQNPFTTYFDPLKTSPFAARAGRILTDRLKDLESDDPEMKVETAKKADFVTRFLKAKAEHPDVVTDTRMMGFVQTNLVAGSDTTAVVLRTALYFAAKNPQMVAKMRKELEDAKVSFPVSYTQAFYELPYTAAYVRESMRYWFVGNGIMERVVPPGGYEFPDGRKLPGGTIVGIQPQVLHLDKEIFGADANEFNPDRYLQGPNENAEHFEARFRAMKAKDLTFGYGPQSCLGRHVAELEIYKVVPTILALLDLELVDPSRPWRLHERFMRKQCDIDMNIHWAEGKSLSSLRRSEA